MGGVAVEGETEGGVLEAFEAAGAAAGDWPPTVATARQMNASRKAVFRSIGSAENRKGSDKERRERERESCCGGSEEGDDESDIFYKYIYILVIRKE